jgi:hypothetical protein
MDYENSGEKLSEKKFVSMEKLISYISGKGGVLRALFPAPLNKFSNDG